MTRYRSILVGLVFAVASGWLNAPEGRAGLINGGFETGDFSGWSTIGNATIQTAAYGAGPTEGTYQALLQTQGGVGVAALESFLGLPSGFLDHLAPPGQHFQIGSAIRQATTSGYYRFDWDFLTNEMRSVPATDIGLFTAASSTASAASGFGNSSALFISGTPFSRETGFSSGTIGFLPSFSVPIEVGFVVLTTDATHSSGLLIDNVQLLPEPASIVMLGLGLLGVIGGFRLRSARKASLGGRPSPPKESDTV